eukprot:388916-Pyramimonas_sp.AAC.1
MSLLVCIDQVLRLARKLPTGDVETLPQRPSLGLTDNNDPLHSSSKGFGREPSSQSPTAIVAETVDDIDEDNLC